MKKILFSVLLLSSTQTFGMFTYIADLRRIDGGLSREEKESLFKKLLASGKTIDDLAQNWLKTKKNIDRFKSTHWEQEPARYNQHKEKIEKEHDQVSEEFKEMQEKLFEFVRCKPRLAIHRFVEKVGNDFKQIGSDETVQCTSKDGYVSCFECIKKHQEIYEQSGTLPFEYRNEQ